MVPFDDSFISYSYDNEPTADAYLSTIYLDKDITEFVDYHVKVATFDTMWVTESARSMQYDIKNTLSREMHPELNGNRLYKGHYDGFLYDGKYTSARGAGNILFGRNMENSILPNAFYKLLAGGLQEWDETNSRLASQVNNKYVRFAGTAIITLSNLPNARETEEALRHYDYGIQQQRQENTGNYLNIQVQKNIEEYHRMYNYE